MQRHRKYKNSKLMLMGVNLTKGDAVALFHCCMGVVLFD